jgi:hypothetical protein
MPWSNWMGINVVVILLSTVPALVALGLWMVMNSLRGRVGIPLLPAGSDADAGAHRRDVLLAGLGLGSMVALLGLGLRLANRGGIPAAPETLLGQAVPALAEALGVPLGVVMSVVSVALPGLALAGISRRWGVRVLVAAAMVAPLLVMGYVTAPAAANPVVRAVVPVAVGLVAAVLSVRWWAAYAGWSWVVGGIVAAGYGGVWMLLHAPTGPERAGGVVTLAVALALLWMAARVTGPWAGVFDVEAPSQGMSAAGTTPASEAAR